MFSVILVHIQLCMYVCTYSTAQMNALQLHTSVTMQLQAYYVCRTVVHTKAYCEIPTKCSSTCVMCPYDIALPYTVIILDTLAPFLHCYHCLLIYYELTIS